MDYWLLRNSEKYGPYSEEQLGQFAEQGNLSGSDRLWREGLEGWEEPLSVLPSLGPFASVREATELPSPETSLAPELRQTLVVERDEQRPRRASFLRSGLTWIPLFGGLLVGALGFQAFLRSGVRADLSQQSEGARFLATGVTDVFLGNLYETNAAFGIFSWGAGFIVGLVNGLSFGAILGWLASRVGLRGSLRARVTICSGLGGAIGLLLDALSGMMAPALALLVGFFGWKEGLLLGACFAAVQPLDKLS